MLAGLFEAMATGGEFGIETIRHFNGNLFNWAESDRPWVLDGVPSSYPLQCGISSNRRRTAIIQWTA
jgi:hypothetical protein